ncbi:MAG: hypothetical protein ACO26F_04460 [Burkholderiaceae bacterium]|jgi:hypothetical protein
MQSVYESHFTREMGCTADELRAWLPGASRQATIRCLDTGAHLEWPGGSLRMHWQALPPRRVALICLPRLSVTFDFGSVTEDERSRFMRHFDLYTQRGGG